MIPDTHYLDLHAYEPTSKSNGPGLRSVLWLQGCTLNCKGCFNPLTHPVGAGTRILLVDLLNTISENQQSLEGITLSGGEPLLQLPALLSFLELLHQRTSLSVLLFSGYTYQQIVKMPSTDRLFSHIDLLIAGPYVENLRQASSLIGSRNKTLHFLTHRYSPADLLDLPEAEIFIRSDGSIHLSGINPIQW